MIVKEAAEASACSAGWLQAEECVIARLAQ